MSETVFTLAARLEEGASDAGRAASEQSGDDGTRADEHSLDEARRLAEDGESARAAHHYLQVIERDPSDATAHREYAALLVETGYPESATRHYETALALDPDPAVRAEYHDLLDAKADGDSGLEAGLGWKDDVDREGDVEIIERGTRTGD